MSSHDGKIVKKSQMFVSTGIKLSTDVPQQSHSQPRAPGLIQQSSSLKDRQLMVLSAPRYGTDRQ